MHESRTGALFCVAGLGALLALAACTEPPEEPAPELEISATPMGWVDEARILAAAEAEPGSWLAHGLDYNERRFSHLTDINRDTIGELGLAWYRDLGNRHRMQATPLVIDGVMYFTDPWSVAYALDTATGEQIWRFDPETDKRSMRYSCCGRRDESRHGGLSRSALLRHIRCPPRGRGPRPPGRRLGRWTPPTASTSVTFPPPTATPTPSPARREPPPARCSSARAVRSLGCAAICLPTTPTPANWHGASSWCRAIPPSLSSTRNSKRRPRPGRANGGGSGAAGRSGTPSSMTRSSISSCSAPATARRGRARFARPREATTSSWAASCRWTPTPGA